MRLHSRPHLNKHEKQAALNAPAAIRYVGDSLVYTSRGCIKLSALSWLPLLTVHSQLMNVGVYNKGSLKPFSVTHEYFLHCLLLSFSPSPLLPSTTYNAGHQSTSHSLLSLPFMAGEQSLTAPATDGAKSRWLLGQNISAHFSTFSATAPW